MGAGSIFECAFLAVFAEDARTKAKQIGLHLARTEMRKYMKRESRCKKVKGDANMISTLIAVIPILALLLYAILLFGQISVKQRAEWSLREYMLAMEVEGYLTDTNKTALTQKLTDLGVANISFEDTTMSRTNYGDRIILHIKGKIKVPVLADTGEWLLQTSEGYDDFTFQFQSTFLGK